MQRFRKMLGLSANYQILARAPIIAKELVALNTDYYVRRREPVIVFSMERTGSVALFQSLIAAGRFAIASHYLDGGHVQPGHRAGRARWATKHIVRPRKPAKIISLVRNPIENMLSVFARKTWGPGTDGPGGPGGDAAEILRQFSTDYLESGKYERPLTWFDTEFKKCLGVDVYQYPFDKEKGLVQFREGPYEVLIVRTELDDASKARAVGEFMGLPDFAMVSPGSVRKRDGVDHGKPGEKTAYGEHYKALKDRAAFPVKYWDAITGSKFAKHFFSQEELNKSRDRFGAAG